EVTHQILIVDDWRDIRQIVGSFLQSLGYKILEAQCGADAIQIAVAEQPKLILLDIRLRDLDGVEIARTLRKTPRTADIPIVGWTGDPASKPSQETLQRAGFVACFEKPVSLIALHVLVERFVPKPQRGL